MDKRQFLAGAALIAATPALAQPQMQKPGTDELGRTLGSMQAKADSAPQSAHHRTVPDSALLAQRHHRRSRKDAASGCSSSAMTRDWKPPGCWTAKARCCTAW